MSFQDLKFLGKEVSPTFSYFFLNNALLYHFFANLSSRGFCIPSEVKFHVFGTSKHGEGKSLSNVFFAILISALWRFYRANKKKSVIYT